MRSAPLSLGATLLVLLSAGCEDWGNQLYIANTTKLGINASLNTTRQAGSIGLGYDRYFVTWVPRSVDRSDASPDADPAVGATRDVMSVLACSRLEVDGLNIKEFDETLATGEAARIFAAALKDEHSSAITDYFRCFQAPQNPGAGEPR